MATGPTDWERQNKDKAASAFEKARQSQQVKQRTAEPVNSEQVKQSAPQMQPKPPSNARGAVDRQAHNERMTKDDKSAQTSRAQELQKGALEQRAQQQREQSKGEKER